MDHAKHLPARVVCVSSQQRLSAPQLFPPSHGELQNFFAELWTRSRHKIDHKNNCPQSYLAQWRSSTSAGQYVTSGHCAEPTKIMEKQYPCSNNKTAVGPFAQLHDQSVAVVEN